VTLLKKIGRFAAGPIPVSVILALLIGACLMLIAGVDPLSGYAAMFSGSFGSGAGFANTLARAIPIIGIGIAIAVAFRAGVLNLGTEGQAGLGALAGGMVAIYLPGPAILVVPLAFLTAIAAGALWGLLAGVLQNSLGVPILLSTLLLNYPARYFVSWMIRFKLDEPTSDLVASEQVRPEIQLSMLVPRDSAFAETLRNTFGPTSPITTLFTSVNWSLVLVTLVVLGAIFVNQRTRYGFESGLSGKNPEFARYSGVRPGPLVLSTMAISGGLAGMVGMILVIGAPNTRLIEGQFLQTNYAWTALLVTLLALYRPTGIVIAGVFFAAIMVGSDAMGRELGLSPQIAAVIQALVIILLAFRFSLPHIRKKRAKPLAEEVER
jgi:ABC-type uncharacterized transport system permease subunit